MSFSPIRFIIRKPKKIGRVPSFFSNYRIRPPSQHHFSREKQFEMYNSNHISTNFESVCNMDNQFKNHINLPNSHPSVLDHC